MWVRPTVVSPRYHGPQLTSSLTPFPGNRMGAKPSDRDGPNFKGNSAEQLLDLTLSWGAWSELSRPRFPCPQGSEPSQSSCPLWNPRRLGLAWLAQPLGGGGGREGEREVWKGKPAQPDPQTATLTGLQSEPTQWLPHPRRPWEQG